MNMAIDPLSLISGFSLQDFGLAGLMTLTILLILTGRLNPRSYAEDWKAAYFKEREAGEVKSQQISELIQANRVAVRALDALPRVHEDGGEPDVSTTAETRQRKAR